MSNKPVFFKLEFPKINPEFPIDPAVRILSRHHGTYVAMTPTITHSEFDKYIDDLIKELEQIRKEGRKKFLQVDTKIQKSLKAK